MTFTAASFLLISCADLPSTTESRAIRSSHPVGYDRLVKIVPDCAQAHPGNYDACRLAAQMAESSTTQLSTQRFLAHWKTISLAETSQTRQVDLTERIILPVLRYLYRFSRDAYSRAMLPEMDRIILTSRNSLNSFEKVHQKNMTAYQR